MITVVLADDHSAYRQALRSTLAAEVDISVVGEAVDGQAAVRVAGEQRPNVVVMDIAMPGLDGVEATRAIATKWPECRVLALSFAQDPRTLNAMQVAGAYGFISKASQPESIPDAIRRVAAGDHYP